MPVRVERWFGESNFHHAEFADLRRLVTLKEKQGLTISLVLPTLNEEETIGPIVRRAMREMVGRVPLLDEILVIDSASTDRTREIAEAEGARVVQHPDILPRYGSFVGKGEALWKSVYEATGDIIVWADTDVKNWHHRMVYGTLGPLLHEPRLQYVKGYYQRPIVEARRPDRGRRRPRHRARRAAAHQPVLPGAVGDDPAAGGRVRRAAARCSRRSPSSPATPSRSATSSTRPSGSGIEGLGQVDLERRIHRNQELEGLSRMSFVILQAVMKRLEERRKTRLFAEMGSTMKLPRSGRGRLSLEVIELADQERPPMIRIPEYLERHRPDGAPEVLAPVACAGAGRAAGASDRTVTARRSDRWTILIAPDSFKGSLTSVEVARALAAGWARARPDDTIVLCPLADGGEGTLEAVAAAGGWTWREATVTDPLGRPIQARWLVRRGRRGPSSRWPRRPACRASRASERDAVGRHLGRDRRPAPRGAGRGRRTLDPGDRRQRHDRRRRGAARGARGRCRPRSPRAATWPAWIHDSPASALAVACDVSNPLLGPSGAAAIYGPQKGATPARRRRARSAARPSWPTRSNRRPARDVRDTPGAGAAGGVGFALLAIAGRVRVVRPSARASTW